MSEGYDPLAGALQNLEEMKDWEEIAGSDELLRLTDEAIVAIKEHDCSLHPELKWKPIGELPKDHPNASTNEGSAQSEPVVIYSKSVGTTEAVFYGDHWYSTRYACRIELNDVTYYYEYLIAEPNKKESESN